MSRRLFYRIIYKKCTVHFIIRFLAFCLYCERRAIRDINLWRTVEGGGATVGWRCGARRRRKLPRLCFRAILSSVPMVIFNFLESLHSALLRFSSFSGQFVMRIPLFSGTFFRGTPPPPERLRFSLPSSRVRLSSKLLNEKTKRERGE